MEVTVHPGSSRLQLVLKEIVWHAYLMAPPVDGEANKALIELVSRSIKWPKSKIVIVSGQQSKNKRLQIIGASQIELDLKLSLIER